MSVRVGHPCHVDHAKCWKRLIRDLNGWTSASEVAPGRIRVSVPQNSGRDRRVVIVMTPDEWVSMFTVAWGSFDAAFDSVKRTLLTLQSHEGFAVYADYRLEPSTSESLPEPPGPWPEPGSGAWVAYDRHGRVAGRFADWPDEPS